MVSVLLGSYAESCTFSVGAQHSERSPGAPKTGHLPLFLTLGVLLLLLVTGPFSFHLWRRRVSSRTPLPLPLAFLLSSPQSAVWHPSLRKGD